MKKYLIVGCLLLCMGCQKALKTSDILTELTANPIVIDADGTSAVTVTVRLTDNAATDKRNVVFTATSGSWKGGADGKITTAATYADGKIIAKATLIAPSSPGIITITAASESLTINGDFNQTATVTANKVEPYSIKMESSSFGIGSNFTSEDTLTAKISGINGNNASKDVRVQFDDLLGSGLTAGGRFRLVSAKSNSQSIVSAIYGSPALSIGTPIQLKVTVLDASGVKTGIANTVTLTVNK